MSTFFKSKDSLGIICKLHRWPFVLLSRRVFDFLCFDYIFSNFCLNFLLLSNGPIKKPLYFWRLYRKKETVKKCIKFFANRTYFPIVQSFYEKQEPELFFLPILSTFIKSKYSLGLICKLHRWPFVRLSQKVSDFLCIDYIFSNFCLNFLLLSNGPIKNHCSSDAFIGRRQSKNASNFLLTGLIFRLFRASMKNRN